MTSNRLSIQCFFNSLSVDMVGETQSHKVGDVELVCASFMVTEGTLLLPLTYHSENARHRYRGDIHLLTEEGLLSDIEFPTAVALVCASQTGLTPEKLDRLTQRVGDSDHYINRAEHSYLQRHAEHLPQCFIESEQALIGGHSMHPSPKSCSPLSYDEQAQFLPEFANSFSIEWFAVSPEVLVVGSHKLNTSRVLNELFHASVGEDETNALPSGWLPYPMHPLQAAAWRNSHDFQSVSSQVLDLKIKSSGWLATSSSRAIYHPKLPWMLKVSLPVKLTNSLRLLSEKEAQRGVLFSQLLDTPAGEELVQRSKHTQFIEEPMWVSIKDKESKTLDLPLVALRSNPFFNSGEDGVHLLATVNQELPQQSSSQVAQWIAALAQKKNISAEESARAWIDHFFKAVIEPLCVARSDYGIVLLAHQQNILLKVTDGLPVGMLYRDCQGVGVTELALKRFDSVLSSPPEYFMTGQEVNPYLAYYVVGNSLINTVASIAAAGLASERALFDVCIENLHRLRLKNPLDSSFYDYLLSSSSLHWKRNFLCFLNEDNEATLENPEQIYKSIPNPLKSDLMVACVKPVIGVSEVTVCCVATNQTGLKQFEIHQLGKVMAGFEVKSNNGELHYHANTEDEMLWWSGLEHVFGTEKTDHVVCSTVPDSVQLNALIPRSEFLEKAPIWHHKDQQNNQHSLAMADNGIEHPARPAKPDDVFYQRYFYPLKRTLTLRVVDKQRDLSAFHRWHNDPAISPIWELEGTQTEHLDYLTKMESDAHQFPVIAEFDGVPFGYFEVYWTAEDRLGPYYEVEAFDRGAHMLSANPRFRGWRYFEVWSKAVVQYCFLVNSQTNHVMGEPRADNAKVLELTRRVGFDNLFEFDFPHKRAAMLQCPRKRFFEQFAI
ncbi:GNAT family N-acetyltransferase [Vibrio sp. SCSIO 43136]|uniref:GNAT family N-acetyltransferase n=1 Tax=Vibrio sp. SCSIO 43136 TaxID=2819101 RepID=UPI00207544CD|nr:GNAT family N-acetyltransferase [Vibrio sp. SCSIO 43136]USD67623.1 GNAT family N-acetyltransferase [Vibrio sp. SCSIO 43136]